ncbi:hypothetical protein MTBPR1_80142 [Candidatus Terasakiella magnetica]|uniref:Uncharacterized protein n=1 Tax=Candidatus Terasakiella magnetica TaxID=1867952 RepID=A0A1C3RLH1_9PROT|nr:hypothetical protein [Candidatus Terasakiella magnetica]SCA58088.1 hypothetical protein MTBPR1_80142 [Candidatus Terasakiella magnetica]
MASQTFIKKDIFTLVQEIHDLVKKEGYQPHEIIDVYQSLVISSFLGMCDTEEQIDKLHEGFRNRLKKSIEAHRDQDGYVAKGEA